MAGSGPLTVQKAHAYDTSLAMAADKAKQQVLAKCKTTVKRARCPHKQIPVPVAPEAEQRDSGQTPTAEAQRGDCEIAQQVKPPTLLH